MECVGHLVFSHNLKRNLTGMAIADITLLSGFDVDVTDLDKVMAVTIFSFLFGIQNIHVHTDQSFFFAILCLPYS